MRMLMGSGDAWFIRHNNRRTYVFGLRLHHGLVGAALFATGVVLMLDDWKDFPWLSN